MRYTNSLNQICSRRSALFYLHQRPCDSQSDDSHPTKAEVTDALALHRPQVPDTLHVWG